jgi:hypothetical protein
LPFAPPPPPGCWRDDDVDLQPHQLGGELTEAFGSPTGPSPFDRNALSLHVAELTQSVLEGIAGQRSVGVEHTDPRNLRKRQRPGGERRDEDANGENDREPDQPHGHLGARMVGGSLARFVAS